MSKRLVAEAIADDILEKILGFRGFTKVATKADWDEYNKYKEELTLIIQNRLEKEDA